MDKQQIVETVKCFGAVWDRNNKGLLLLLCLQGWWLHYRRDGGNFRDVSLG